MLIFDSSLIDKILLENASILSSVITTGATGQTGPIGTTLQLCVILFLILDSIAISELL